MVKPPDDARRGRILEIDNGVLVAREFGFVEERARAMHQPHVFELHMLTDALAIKAGKQRSRTGPVKTLVVVKNPDLHRPFLLSLRQGTTSVVPLCVLSGIRRADSVRAAVPGNSRQPFRIRLPYGEK